LTGRISTIIPFFPFTQEEAAVVAHQFISRAAGQYLAPIDTKKSQIGHVYTNLIDDGLLCMELVKSGYSVDTGARSIAGSVDRLISLPIVNLFLDQPGGLSEEINQGPFLQINAKVVVTSYEYDLRIVVNVDGVSPDSS